MTSSPHDLDPDPPLSAQQRSYVQTLTTKQLGRIDTVLRSHVPERWRKVAMVIALAMEDLADEIPGIPDVYCAERIKGLVGSGLLEAQGDLDRMRYSEVRQAKVKV